MAPFGQTTTRNKQLHFFPASPKSMLHISLFAASRERPFMKYVPVHMHTLLFTLTLRPLEHRIGVEVPWPARDKVSYLTSLQNKTLLLKNLTLCTSSNNENFDSGNSAEIGEKVRRESRPN